MQIRQEFQVPKLNTLGMDRTLKLARSFSDLLNAVEQLMPGHPMPSNAPGARELAIARTKLQEAFFFAKRAISIQLMFQELPPTTDG